MPKTMIDEFQLRIFVPDRLTPAEARAIRRTLDAKGFQVALRQTLRTFLGRYPALAKVKIQFAA